MASGGDVIDTFRDLLGERDAAPDQVHKTNLHHFTPIFTLDNSQGFSHAWRCWWSSVHMLRGGGTLCRGDSWPGRFSGRSSGLFCWRRGCRCWFRGGGGGFCGRLGRGRSGGFLRRSWGESSDHLTLPAIVADRRLLTHEGRLTQL